MEEGRKGWTDGLTAESQQAGIGDGRLAQVQHLEHREVFRQEPQAGVSKLWGRDLLSLETYTGLPRAPGAMTPRQGQRRTKETGQSPGLRPMASTPQGLGRSRFSPETPVP